MSDELQLYLFRDLQPDPSKGNIKWKLFSDGQGNFFLPLYSQYPTPRVVPRDFQRFSRRIVAQSSYSYGRRKRFITTHLISGRKQDLLEAGTRRGYKTRFYEIPGFEIPADTDQKNDIHCSTTLVGSQLDALIKQQRWDIMTHCKDHPPASQQEDRPHYEKAQSIKGDFSINRIPPKFRFSKQGKRAWHPNCNSHRGYNTFSEGCITNITPDGFYDPEGRCAFCYASDTNSGAANNTVYDFSIDDLVKIFLRDVDEIESNGDKKGFNVRLGQNSEIYWPREVRERFGISDEDDNFYKTLAALKEANRLLAGQDKKILGSLSSRLLEFDDRYVPLIKDAGLQLMISLDYSALEEGALRMGSTVKQRLDTGLEYTKQGCPVTYFVGVDVTRGQDSWQEDAQQAFDFFLHHKEDLRIQFVSMRLPNKRVAEHITGESWERLKETGRYKLYRGSSLNPQSVHTDYLRLMDEHKGSVSLCAAYPPLDYCGGCGF